MVTKKFKHKDNNGTVTEYDIGALAANVLHSDGQTAEQKGAVLSNHLDDGKRHLADGGNNNDILARKNVHEELVFGSWSWDSDTYITFSNFKSGNLSSMTVSDFQNKTIQISGYGDLNVLSNTPISINSNNIQVQITLTDTDGYGIYESRQGTDAKFIGDVIAYESQWISPHQIDVLPKGGDHGQVLSQSISGDIIWFDWWQFNDTQVTLHAEKYDLSTIDLAGKQVVMGGYSGAFNHTVDIISQTSHEIAFLMAFEDWEPMVFQSLQYYSGTYGYLKFGNNVDKNTQWRTIDTNDKFIVLNGQGNSTLFANMINCYNVTGNLWMYLPSYSSYTNVKIHIHMSGAFTVEIADYSYREIKWSNGTAPTFTNGKDYDITLTKYQEDGDWFGSYVVYN